MRLPRGLDRQALDLQPACLALPAAELERVARPIQANRARLDKPVARSAIKIQCDLAQKASVAAGKVPHLNNGVRVSVDQTVRAVTRGLRVSGAGLQEAQTLAGCFASQPSP